MDNVLMHTSNSIFLKWIKLDFKFLIIPSSSTQYASIKNSFSTIKSYIRLLNKLKNINYNKSIGIEWILRQSKIYKRTPPGAW